MERLILDLVMPSLRQVDESMLEDLPDTLILEPTVTISRGPYLPPIKTTIQVEYVRASVVESKRQSLEIKCAALERRIEELTKKGTTP